MVTREERLAWLDRKRQHRKARYRERLRMNRKPTPKLKRILLPPYDVAV